MTIEYRAKQYAQNTGWVTIQGDEEATFMLNKEGSYIKGATDQQNIDIEKAWQWMRKRIKLIGSEMELHSEFVKAMKG